MLDDLPAALGVGLLLLTDRSLNFINLAGSLSAGPSGPGPSD
jgi:hypothetical protein